MTSKEPRRKIRTTKFDQSLLCILFAAEPRSLSLDELEHSRPRADILWSLKQMLEWGLVERGTDPQRWQLTTYGRKYWKGLVDEALKIASGKRIEKGDPAPEG